MPANPETAGRWVHFIETTYGAWLHGDDRGFRTRHHREHVEGDYKTPPPPGMYEDRRRRSVENLKQAPTILGPKWRPIVGTAVRTRLELADVFVLCLSVGGQHMHLLAKLPVDAKARTVMGLAKKHAAFEAKARGWTGRLWGKRGKEVEVRERAHQRNVYRYILAHAAEGAWVWRWNPEGK